ncbi:hypothetical protein DRJ22_01540 [Candidatus Woesearchaeota archaeon]|nr:MAG: hypothetical protein DRJ22_01540 [Candidatus Woesearchaeota archaeon]
MGEFTDSFFKQLQFKVYSQPARKNKKKSGGKLMKKTIALLVIALLLTGAVIVGAEVSGRPNAKNSKTNTKSSQSSGKTPEQLAEEAIKEANKAIEEAEKALEENKPEIEKAVKAAKNKDLEKRAKNIEKEAEGNLKSLQNGVKKLSTELQNALNAFNNNKNKENAKKLIEAEENLEKTIEALEKAKRAYKAAAIKAAALNPSETLWKYLTENAWVFSAFVLKAYQEYGNFMSWTSIFPGLTRKDIEARKDELNQKFCIIGGIGKCFKSAICEHKFKKRAGQGTLISQDITGAPINVAQINGYKVGPIKIKGLPRTTLIDWFGETVMIKGLIYNFSDPNFDPTKLPEQDLYLYQVQYTLSNPESVQERGFYKPASTTLKYNLKFIGERTATWWPEPQKLAVGNSTQDNILKYSFNNYDKVCLTFSPSIRETGLGGHKVKSEICNKFVTYEGPPTLITGQPSQANPATQTSGPGGMI